MINDNTIFCCELTDKSETSETATEFFSAYGYDFSAYIDAENRKTKYILYFDNFKSAESAAADIAEIPEEWVETGISFSDIHCFSIEKKDWAEVWKKHFTIQHISETMTIKPTWLNYSPKSEKEIIVEIDPGMSFGTGRHATTRFCLKMLEQIPEKNKTSFLDAGCGSGILTIAAVKSNFKTVTAFDIDQACIKCTEENLELNNIKPSDINLFSADIAQFAKMQKADSIPRKYTVVTANILSHILYDNRKIITSFIKPGGYLILAGILTEEYPEIRNAFTENGLIEKNSSTEDEWTGGLFRN